MVGEPGHAFAIEADDVRQHAPETAAEQIARLSEERRQIVARPLQIGMLEADRKRHLRFDAVDAEQREHRDEIGIGALVEDEKAGVDRMRYAGQGDIHRIRVSAEIIAGLEHRHLMATRQQPRGGKPGNPGADDGNALLLRLRGIHDDLLSTKQSETELCPRQKWILFVRYCQKTRSSIICSTFVQDKT